jgi:hypothetical protein
MAGGEIPLGIFAEYTDDDANLTDIVERLVTRRLVDGLGLSRRRDADDETTEE